MRLGAWLCAGLLGLLPLGACSGGYPLPPTPCDDWCHTTKGTWGYSCGNTYGPASCVSECETAEFGNANCRTQFDAALSCYRGTPPMAAEQCWITPNYVPPCLPQFEALAACVVPYIDYYGGPGQPRPLQ